MKVRSGSEAYGSGHRHDEGTSSKRHRTLEEAEAEGSDVGGSKLRKVGQEEKPAEMDTSSGNDYIPERSEGGGSFSGSESLETESEYFAEFVGTDSREVSKTGRGKRRTVSDDVDAMWRLFEEESLMNSFGSDFEPSVDSGRKVVQMCHWWRNQ